MRKWTEGFGTLNTGGETWFAGANTERGFVGCYSGIADERRLERLYIIKGGPGTGKSTLIRQAADAAERAGFPVARYLCGSDPGSLDAAVFDGRIAVVDGTAPHTLDMDFPGASSSLLDCSRFWDAGLLEAKREEIVRLCAAKREEYAAAYRYLGAAGRLLEEERAVGSECLEREKALRYARRLAKRIRRQTGTERGPDTPTVRRFTHAVTMRGLCAVPTLKESAETVFAAEDAMGTAQPFLELLVRALEEEGLPLTVGYYPVGDRISGIRAGSVAILSGAAKEGETPIRMTRFLRGDGSLRGRLRLASKIAGSALEAASARLEAAAEYHFALEEIYGSAMDYDRLAEFRRETAEEILARLTR